MKKLLLLTVLFSIGLMAVAQNYESIRNTALLQQYQKAKEELDKAWSNSKFSSKPEAYALKAFVYASMAMDPKLKGSEQFFSLLSEADAAYKKYKEMDPAQTLATDQIYQNGPVNLYSGYYTAGYDDYTTKKWEQGYTNLKKALEYSELLIEKKLLTATIDTNVLILAGITAENGGHKDEAAKLYSRLADKKITGDGFESVYRFLVSHFFGKKEMASFEKYKAIGAELYPKSEYFTFDKIDFAVGLVTSFDEKLKAVEDILFTIPDISIGMSKAEVLKTLGTPNNISTTTTSLGTEEMIFFHICTVHLDEKGKVDWINVSGSNTGTKNNNELVFKGNEVLGEIIYDTLNPKDENLPLHSNASELEKKMVAAFQKAAAAKPGYENPFLYMGDHFINKAVNVDAERTAFAAEMKTRTKPGQPNSKEDIAKRDALDKKYGDALELAKDPYEKTADIFKARGTLDQKEKQQYKKVASYLADIFAFKKVMATRAKSPDAAKYAAEEKKWNELWESIK